jgi:hypothetical protein
MLEAIYGMIRGLCYMVMSDCGYGYGVDFHGMD